MKKLLILGGTRQVGRRLIEIIHKKYANDFEITLFNRGKTNPHLFPNIRKIKGDRRTKEIEQIFKESWDIVLDCTAYEPFSTTKILNGLSGKVNRYILISTISVYDKPTDFDTDLEVDESFPLKKIVNENLLTEGLKFYGQKKVASEFALLESDIPRKIILRPHFLFGKYDFQNTDYYWINRIKNHDTILLPNHGNDLIHRSYMEDFISIILKMFTYAGEEIIFNTTTHQPQSLRAYLDDIQLYFNKEVDFINASNSLLEKHQIRPFFDLPFWNNSPNIIYNNEKLKREISLKLTPIKTAIHETIALDNDGNSWANGRFGLTRAKESLLLK